MTTFTSEDRAQAQSEVIQGATGAQYRFMGTSPQAQEVNMIINALCSNLQALGVVLNKLRNS